MSQYSFDEAGVCCASKPGYTVKRPINISDMAWERLAVEIIKAIDAEALVYEGFANQGRRLYQLCVERGAAPGQTLKWLKDRLDENHTPIRHNAMLYEYPGSIFVLFDGTDDGCSIHGAYRSLDEALKRQAFYARMENEGPNAYDPIGFENADALQTVLKEIWWKGFNNGRGQVYAGHNQGYEHVDCTTDVDGYIVGKLGRKR